jgi:hypothetical protein
MRSFIHSKKFIFLSAIGIAALAAPLSHAADYIRSQTLEFNDQNSVKNWVDFAATTANTYYDTWTDPLNHPNMNFIPIEISNYLQGGPGVCYGIGTGGLDNSYNKDTRIYVQNTGGTFISLSDDSGGKLYSYARVWVAPISLTTSGRVKLRISGYDTNWNNVDFILGQSKVHTATNAASCRLAGVPFADLSTGSFPIIYDSN